MNEGDLEFDKLPRWTKQFIAMYRSVYGSNDYGTAAFDVVAVGGITDWSGYGWILACVGTCTSPYDKWLWLDWSYGSCSGCDPYLDNEKELLKTAAQAAVLSGPNMTKFLQNKKLEGKKWSDSLLVGTIPGIFVEVSDEH